MLQLRLRLVRTTTDRVCIRANWLLAMSVGRNAVKTMKLSTA